MLSTTELRPEWWSLFDQHTPNDVILRSALTRRCPGLAYLDRGESPEQIVVRAHGGKAFASPGASESFLHQTIDHAKRLGWTSLADTGIPNGVRERGRVVERTRFDDCDLGSETLRSLRGQLPRELEVQSLDRDLLQRCHHAKRELPKDYGDNLDPYFDFGYGICLLRGGDVVCEAYMVYVAGGARRGHCGDSRIVPRARLGVRRVGLSCRGGAPTWAPVHLELRDRERGVDEGGAMPSVPKRKAVFRIHH